MINKRDRSQAILDFVLLFGVLLVFLLGLVRIWTWFNATYARRNATYQVERLIVGKANDATAGAYLEVPLRLTDDWVFGGRPSGNIDWFPDDTGEDPTADNCASARESAASMREQAHNINCQIRDLSQINCRHDATCESSIDDGISDLSDQVDELMEQADTIEMGGCDSVEPYQEPAECS